MKPADIRALVEAGEDDPWTIAWELTGATAPEDVRAAEDVIQQVFEEWSARNIEDLQKEKQ